MQEKAQASAGEPTRHARVRAPRADLYACLPLVAVGGITRANALEVFAAGADSVALIHDILPETCTFSSVRARMEEWQRLAKI
jgi:thiamine monophosphate synthase